MLVCILLKTATRKRPTPRNNWKARMSTDKKVKIFGSAAAVVLLYLAVQFVTTEHIVTLITMTGGPGR